MAYYIHSHRLSFVRKKGLTMRKSNTLGGKIDRLEYQEAQLTILFNHLKYNNNRQLLFDNLLFRKRNLCNKPQGKVPYC